MQTNFDKFEEFETVGILHITPGGAAYMTEDGGWKVVPLSRAELQQLTSGGANADQDHDGHVKSGPDAGERET